MAFEIKDLRGVILVNRPDGLIDINVDIGILEDEVGQRIEFTGHPWQEGLTEEEVHNLVVGGYSIDDLVSASL